MRWSAVLGLAFLATVVGGCSSPPDSDLGKALATGRYQTLWAGGSANQNGEGRSTVLDTSIRVDGRRVEIRYPYMNGRVEGDLSGNVLRGTWTQKHPEGTFSGGVFIEFQPDGDFGAGWWMVEGDPLQHHLEIRRIDG